MRKDELGSVGVDPVDIPKLAGNQNVRNTVTGQFTKETERFDPERVLETDDRHEIEKLARIVGRSIVEARKQIDQGADADFQVKRVLTALLGFQTDCHNIVREALPEAW